MNERGAAASSGTSIRWGSGWRCRGVLVALLLVVSVGCSAAEKPTLGDAVDTVETVDPAPQPAEGPVTSDGLTLAADRLGEGTRALILAHQRGSDRTSWASFAATLADNGFLVIVPDFRGYGDSPGDRDTNLDLDLVAAVDYAKAQGADEVIIIGASMGGTAAIAVATEVGAIGVVSLSGLNAFAGLDALAAAGNLTVPTLFFAAEGDAPYVDQVAAQATAAGDEAQVFSGGAHGTSLLDEHGEAIGSQILAFAANI